MASTVTESPVYGATVTVPDDADTLNAASVTAAGVGFQELANRTANLAARCGGDVGVPAEFTYLDAAGSPQAKTRVRIVSPYNFGHSDIAGAGGEGWFGLSGGVGVRTLKNRAELILDLNRIVPDFGVVTLVRALIQPGAARAAQTSVPGDNGRMWMGLYRVAPNFGVPAVPSSPSLIGGVEDGGTAGPETMSTGTISQTIAKASNYLYLRLTAGNTAGASPDDVYAFEITYDDNGPQNF